MAKRTPLYDNHLKHNGKMVEFAGYELPIQYEAGLVAEHNAVRNAAGLFDVSHMGELELKGKGAAATVQNIITNDISDMVDGQVKYSLMLNDKGGEVDDLLVYRISAEHFLLVVNASNMEKDAEWVKNHLQSSTQFFNTSEQTGQIALQGPNAEKILAKLTSTFPTKYYTFLITDVLGAKNVIISRTGYTGEDGFEIYCSSDKVAVLFEAVMQAGKEFGLLPCGLGCRDTLRFEACLPLYGHELADDYLATEVGFGFCIKMAKENFIGKKALETVSPQWKRKGFKLVGKGIAREGCKIYTGDSTSSREIGFVTSGTHSPTLGYPVAMARILKDFEGERVFIDVRGRMIEAEAVKMPFYKRPQ